MRGLDTNVLLRYITLDDPQQTPAARAILEGAELCGETLRISTITLCELVWTLKSRRYGYDRQALAGLIESLLATPLFEVADSRRVHLALSDFRQGPGDFADYLIGRQNQAAGCSTTVTFDLALEDQEGFEVMRPTFPALLHEDP